MKWNWGTKLALWMAAFMLMIIVFVVLMMRENVSLVEKDYYPKGQSHQDLIDKKRNTGNVDELIRFEKTEQGLKLVFPDFFDKEAIRGNVHFYQRMDAGGDKIVALEHYDSVGFILPIEGLNGRYIGRIDWEYEGVAYYSEKSITLP